MARLLLISNSTVHGRGYLDHVDDELQDFLASLARVVFVPFALYDRNRYAAQVAARLAKMGCELTSVHDVSNPQRVIREADAVFVGGGNTFRLLKGLYEWNLLESIRQRVFAGMPYIGSSAGSIVACPTLKTTKDMPVLQPPSFDALGLVRFQISPHYLDPDPSSTHMGETQEQRILQYLEENEAPVVGLREGGFLRVEGESVWLKGSAGARVFRRGHQPVEVSPGTSLERLLALHPVEALAS
jgi:dipeptidase E